MWMTPHVTTYTHLVLYKLMTPYPVQIETLTASNLQMQQDAESLKDKQQASMQDTLRCETPKIGIVVKGTDRS